ncbi:uncharacterized protein LOC108150864 [Drosophila miranda]|uniref:uncharacterized protein LOC108150864 n=1 Tax=Drosophila miranda TaxID=7229 RepID=UPI000069624C|nr:uncharacterized protein LOC108150864 [Drosophila miranda]
MRDDDKQRYQAAAIAFVLVLQQCSALPYTSSIGGNEIDSDGNYQHSGGGRSVDYHTVVGHFKDFFMYLPVMMTTIKETMSGFPKFAEGVRILTSGKGRVDGGEDCKCSKNALGTGDSSEMSDGNGRFG